jgi:hypothetical protein
VRQQDLLDTEINSRKPSSHEDGEVEPVLPTDATILFREAHRDR